MRQEERMRQEEEEIGMSRVHEYLCRHFGTDGDVELFLNDLWDNSTKINVLAFSRNSALGILDLLVEVWR